MIIVSILTVGLVLFIYKFTSNQEGIKKIKNKIKAHLLELRLFQDSMSISLKAQGNILRANLKYLGYNSKPLIVMIIPLILILLQLDSRYAYESFSLKEKTILRIKLVEGIPLMDTKIDIKTGSGIVLETPPLRIEESNEINWRIRMEEIDVHEIIINVDGQEYTKSISIGQNNLNRISPMKTRKNFLKEVFNPTESPLPKSSPIEFIEITYPSKKMNLFGLRIHWLIAYLALTFIIGFSLKGFFKVEI